jgi:D-alanine-D-alanine ligase
MNVVILYDLDPFWSQEAQADAERETRRLGNAMRRQGLHVALTPVTGTDVARAMAPHDPADTIVFNWCESLPGMAHSEPDAIRALERLSFTCTGASARTLRLCYDKARVKRMLDKRHVPTPRWAVSRTGDDIDWPCYPAIVKPAREHCSLGVTPKSVVTNAAELKARVRDVVRHFNQPALVEDFIDGREFHVPLWGNRPVEMLPPVEMDFSAFLDFHNRLCTYDAKFVPESAAYRKIVSHVPARLTEDENAELMRVCRAAYKTVGCRDYGRIDVRLRNGVFYVLDVNPNADISADASVALAASKAGFCYGRLGRRIVELAAQRHPNLHVAP